ncbi:hypothetical protein LIER_04008 [Lithospermum erythrorhizon]|uniref:O-fucosyltransferase family protein n=1 Tax=Lithospermum erythrorhizon TaxID=34254 RepID=A0AAV3NV82_LITER
MIKSKIKWAALVGLVLSFSSLIIHLMLTKSNTDLMQFHAIDSFNEDFNYINSVPTKGAWRRKLWGRVKVLETLQPHAAPRSTYPVVNEQNNGFIFAKIFGGFERIRSSICDLVTLARLLNATLIVPEFQESLRSKGISSNFKSFSYIYNEDHFIQALANDVSILKNLPPEFKEARKQKQYPIFKPKISTGPDFYMTEVLPKLIQSKVVGLVLGDGGCLQPILPPSFAEYQRLRCRVAFHALHFRPEIISLGRLMVDRLRAAGQPYLVYHPGLKRDTLAYHGCAELFQDVHTELIQFRRAQMIKQGTIKEELNVDSHARKQNGSCPLMPEEVGLLLRAMGYPPRTRIYLAGSETFGGQRILIPLRSMYTNLVDRTSLCSKQELANLVGSETALPIDQMLSPPAKIDKQLKEDWDKAGPRPRPLPPPPDRPLYTYEKEGWYGWVAEGDSEPDPSQADLRDQAHRLLWDALDYVVSVEADAFFPGYDNDGSGSSDFSSLVMGHRLYESTSARTYRPDRKYLVELFNRTSDHLYYPQQNWTLSVREHLNESLAVEGLLRESRLGSFLSHPIQYCSCTTIKTAEMIQGERDGNLQRLFEGLDECPESIKQARKPAISQDGNADEAESQEDGADSDAQLDEELKSTSTDPTSQQDEEMDPDD